MGGFKIGVKGTTAFPKTTKHFKKMTEVLSKTDLDEYGRMGVVALSDATPKDSGETAAAWDYQIVKQKDGAKLIWVNNNVTGSSNVPVVVLIQYGHLSKAGVYVEGNDFINPALKPILDDMREKYWKEVKKA